MAIGDTYVFPGFLTPVITLLFFPQPPTTFLTCFCRGERHKYARKKSQLNRGSNSQPPGHESDRLTTEPPERDLIESKCKIVLGYAENVKGAKPFAHICIRRLRMPTQTDTFYTSFFTDQGLIIVKVNDAVCRHETSQLKKKKSKSGSRSLTSLEFSHLICLNHRTQLI